MPNQRHSRTTIVLKGTAPELCLPHMKKFKKKHVVKTMPG